MRRFALLLGLLTACGSPGGGGDPDASAGPPDAGPAAGACGQVSGYEGDDACLAPPPADKGFQLHYGPTNYDDPSEVAGYLLLPGDEVVDCVYLKAPSSAPAFVNEFHSRMRPGSHHLLVTAQGEQVPDGHRACNDGIQTRLFLGAQDAIVDIPDGLPVPENQGLAMRLDAGTQMGVQVHFFNSTDKPILREAWVNVLYADPDTVTQIADPMFLVTGLAMSIEPHTDEILTGSCEAPADIRLINGSGHYHSHTTQFTAWKVTPAGERSLIYQSFSWHDPGLFPWDSGHQNPTPDPTTATAGAASGDIYLKAGDRIEWECRVHNDGETTLHFANEVDTAEMCVMFGSYTPSLGDAWTCFQN